MCKFLGRWFIVRIALLLLLLPLIAARHKPTDVALNGPFQLAFDPQDNLYVAEHYGNRIVRIDSNMGSVVVVAGNGKECCFREGALARETSVYDVYSLAVDAKGNVYFGGRNARDDAFVRKIDGLTGRINTVAGKRWPAFGISAAGIPSLQADVSDPKGLIVTKSGSLFVSVDGSNQIAELTAFAKTVAGNASRKSFSGDGGLAINAAFDLPSSLAMDRKGNLFVADYFNHRIRRIDADTQVVTTVAGNGVATSSGDDGLATEASIQYPFGIAVDSEGNLYIIENGTGTVRCVESKTGLIRTVAGTGQPGFSGDGELATQARLDPAGIAVDSHDRVFISDISDNRIRTIDRQTGIITTVAGNGLPKRKTLIE
jgi:sugar lactone lactonase YvrE